jgi:hypothetical protein
VLQAEHALREREGPLNNVRSVGIKMKTQYTERCEAYEALFESVNSTVSAKFRNYMQRRQHEVRGESSWGCKAGRLYSRGCVKGCQAEAAVDVTFGRYGRQ